MVTLMTAEIKNDEQAKDIAGVSRISIEDVSDIKKEIKQCINVYTKTKRGKNVSREDFAIVFKEVTTDFYARFIGVGFRNKESKFTLDDETTYLENIFTICDYIEKNFPEKLVTVGNTIKTLPEAEEPQASEIRKCTKKAVNQIGLMHRVTGVIQIPALLAVMCTVVLNKTGISRDELASELIKEANHKLNEVEKQNTGT